MIGATTDDGPTANVASGPSMGDFLFARLPGPIAESLTFEQKDAIYRAAAQTAWGRHPVNIRLSIPFFARRFYVTLIGGEEKRTAERRRSERSRYPLRTAANILFFLGIAVVIYVAALLALAIHVSVIEL